MNGGGSSGGDRWSDAPDHLPPSSPLRPLEHDSSAAAPSPPPPSPPPSLPIVEDPPKPNSPTPETPNPDTPGTGGIPPSSTSNSSSSASSDDDADDAPSCKKQRSLSSFAPSSPAAPATADPSPVAPPAIISANKKPKKKGNSVWTKSTSRKGKKKGKAGNNNNLHHHHHQAVVPAVEDTVLMAPAPRFPDKTDDSPDAKICLSKVYKAEKVELSEDRLTAGSTKGYRMVRATRGVLEGAWYFEIRIVRLGETGHTRLGWTTEKGDLQAPVGYDGNSYGYRDIDGVKVHKALREKYGEEGYTEGDVIGFYINLPDGAKYAPKPPHLVWYKGQRYISLADAKDDPPKVVPGSEISFFKNGVCQGVAFADLFGGRYYPAASMYTLPNNPNCEVRFNFGPDFEFFPQDFGSRPAPLPMIEVPYHGYDSVKVEGPPENGTAPENK